MFDYTRSEVVAGGFMLVGLAVLGYLSISIGGVRILPRDDYRVSARFSNVGDLKLRAPVKLAGVTVGQVRAIRLADYYGEAELSIARKVVLPKDTMASIATAGLLGDAFVSLSPGAADGNLGDGNRIAQHGAGPEHGGHHRPRRVWRRCRARLHDGDGRGAAPHRAVDRPARQAATRQGAPAMITRSSTTVGFALAMLLASASPVQGRTLDRRGAIRAALAQNPQIAAARAEEAAVQAQLRQVQAARMPLVTLDAGIGPSLIATLVPGTAAQSTQDQYRNLKLSDVSAVLLGNLTVIQPIYTFGKISWRGEAARHGLASREAQTRMQRADVAFEVAQIYEGYLLARDAERFFDEMDHWLDSTLQGSEEKLAQNVGSVTERDLLRLQSAQGLAALGLNQARAGMAQARAGLAAYLGLDPNEAFSVAEDELLPVGRMPEDFVSVAALASERRPELAALREGQSALAALARAEAAGRAPDLFVLGFVSAAYTPGRDWLQTRFVVDPLNHFVPGLLVGLRWELQGGMAPARAAEQQARADVLRHMGAWAGAGIPAEARKAYEDVRRADKDLERAGQALQKAKRWMVTASADYDVGFLDIRELSDAVEAYVTLRTAVLKARFDHNVGMAALSKATGTLDGDARLFYLDEGTVRK